MTIRLKLTLGAIAIVLIANSVLCLVSVCYVEWEWQREITNRVQWDLSSARAAYDSRLADITHFLEAAALDRSITHSLKEEDRAVAMSLLQPVYQVGGMDYLLLLDRAGKVVCRVCHPEAHGDDLSADPVVARALRSHCAASGTVIFSPQRLARESIGLAERASFDLRPTEASRASADTVRRDGLIMEAAVPVATPEGAFVGLLCAGHLLNRSYEIVDTIKSEVLPQQLYRGRDIGTVTIFLGDLRVSTNVVGPDQQRAVGTRMSEAVFDQVLQRGESWAGPAFVVQDWYISAYEPIRNPQGEIIGALYVGLLQAPFREQQHVVIGVFLAIVTAATMLSLVLLYLAARYVLRPIGPVIEMSRKVVEGDLSARVEIRPPGEMGVLCQAVNEMADAVAQREEQIKLATRQQIGRSEKLASIGRLAAGVAHEINNPLTGVLTFAHLLREKPNMDEQDQQDLELIIHETSRAAEIVRGLLDFARERAAMKEPLDINQVITRTLRLILNQKSFDRISIVEQLQEGLPEVHGDMNQLQQVFLNLTLNACEAMPEGGTITVRSLFQEGKVQVRVADTGYGIKPEHLEQIYEPFFSTKPMGKGTGLGLSVSYGIVQQHGGTIDVESQEGRGTTFAISLPPYATEAEPEEPREEKASV